MGIVANYSPSRSSRSRSKAGRRQQLPSNLQLVFFGIILRLFILFHISMDLDRTTENPQQRKLSDRNVSPPMALTLYYNDKAAMSSGNNMFSKSNNQNNVKIHHLHSQSVRYTMDPPPKRKPIKNDAKIVVLGERHSG